MPIGTPQLPTSLGITTMLPSLLLPSQTSPNFNSSRCFGVRGIPPPSSATYKIKLRLETISHTFSVLMNQMVNPARMYFQTIPFSSGRKVPCKTCLGSQRLFQTLEIWFHEWNILLDEGVLTPKSCLVGAAIFQQRRQPKFGCSRLNLWPGKESSSVLPHVQELRLAFNGLRTSLQLAYVQFWRRSCLTGTEIEPQDMFQEQNDIVFSHQIIYREEAMLIPKCARATAP